MRIAIDARMIRPGSMHGIARYVFQLLKGLTRLGSNHHYLVLVVADSPLYSMTWPDHMELVPVNARWISFREQFVLPRLLKSLKVDLCHAPSFVAPIMCPCTLVMTIHDLNHIVLSELYTPIHQVYYQLFVRGCIRRSKYILTVSQFSRREIIRTLSVPGDKILVTYNGVSPNYRPITDDEKRQYVREVYSLPEQFVFCLSNNKPHKNVAQLVRAYCATDIAMPLVLACAADIRLIRIAEKAGKKHLLHFVRFIAEDHLATVYSLAHLFVYPSAYEGFGLPPLEALACGVPVVVAQSSSLPEVVGDAAIFADPADYMSIAHALTLGVSDTRLRENLRTRGIAQARRFSWDNMVRQSLKVYEACLDSSKGPALAQEALTS